MINQLLSHIDYRTLFNELGEGIVYVQQDGVIAFLNNEAKKIFRPFPLFTAGQNIYQQPWHIFLKSGKEISAKEFAPAVVLQSGNPVHNSIVKMVSQSGDFIWIDVNADPVGKKSSGEFEGVILTLVELSDVMQEKQNLRYREEKYRIFFQSSEAATFLATRAGKYLAVSKGAEKIFGYETNELLQAAISDVIVPDENYAQAHQQAEQHGSAIAEVTGRRKNGELFPVLFNVSNFTTSTGEELSSIVMIDILDKKEMEKSAKKTAFNLELILHNTDDAFLVTDNEMRVVMFNDSYSKTIKILHGSDIHEGDFLIDLIASARKEHVHQIMKDVLNGHRFDGQRSVIEKGNEKVYNSEIRPLYEAGKIIGIFVQLKDVTATFKMQEQLRKSNERFELAVKASYDLIWDIDLESKIVQFNDVMEKVFLHSFPWPLPLHDFMQLVVYKDDAAMMQKAVEDFLRSDKITIEYPVHRMKRGDGSIAYVQVNAVKVTGGGGAVTRVIGVTRDITEKYLLQEKLKENIERYLMARKATKDILYELDPGTGSVFYNDSLFETLGYHPHEITNIVQAYKILIHPDDVKKVTAQLEDFKNSREEIFVYPDFRMLHKNGSVLFVEVKTIATRDASGTLIKAYGNIKDITERYLMQEQLRNSNERFELAARASYDILWDADLKQQQIYFSEAIETNLGIAGPIVISFRDFYANLLHPDDIDLVSDSFSALLYSSEQNARLPDHRLLKADGSYAYVKSKMYGVRDFDGHLNRIIGVTTDITHQKQYELSLEKLNSDLKSQAHDLKQSNVELERFAYVASHDLQEPLRMVSSFLSLTQKKYESMLDDTGRQYIHFAVEGAERMKRLILDLLQFSKIGFNKVGKEEIDTMEICRDLTDEFVFTIKEKNAVIDVKSLPKINANKGQMIHVFRNLLSNALKYVQQEPVIEIGCSEKEHCWQFYVQDNGIGIDEKYFEKIFIIFQQLHNKSEYSGSGIGLAIAKKIVEQNGGAIWVRSKKDEGSTFYFTIAK